MKLKVRRTGDLFFSSRIMKSTRSTRPMLGSVFLWMRRYLVWDGGPEVDIDSSMQGPSSLPGRHRLYAGFYSQA